jgi:hypothetical protein
MTREQINPVVECEQIALLRRGLRRRLFLSLSALKSTGENETVHARLEFAQSERRRIILIHQAVASLPKSSNTPLNILSRTLAHSLLAASH